MKTSIILAVLLVAAIVLLTIGVGLLIARTWRWIREVRFRLRSTLFVRYDWREPPQEWIEGSE
jgi:hypothetical protein